MGGGRDTEKSKKTPRLSQLIRRHLVLFSKLGNTEKGIGPGEKNQDEKPLSVTCMQDIQTSVSNRQLRTGKLSG